MTKSVEKQVEDILQSVEEKQLWRYIKNVYGDRSVRITQVDGDSTIKLVLEAILRAIPNVDRWGRLCIQISAINLYAVGIRNLTEEEYLSILVNLYRIRNKYARTMDNLAINILPRVIWDMWRQGQPLSFELIDNVSKS